MRLFRRRHDGASRGEMSNSSPAEASGGMKVALLSGTVTLEVVGESYRQDNLWAIVGGRTNQHIDQAVVAVLVPEQDNQYDPNAISIWVNGLMVGYLSRATAAQYRQGLVDLYKEHQMPVALEGEIVGGGPREDGIGQLGVFLRHDPSDFGDFGSTGTSDGAEARHVRTGAHDLLQRGGLDWLAAVPADDAKAITHLRQLLTHEDRAIERHFIFAELEHRLYRCRNTFASALDEYDAVCREHDGEADQAVPALVELVGGVPLLDLYRQAAVRHQHAKNWEEALWWAQRGLTLYGDRALNPEWPDYLANRANRYQAELTKPAKTPRERTPRKVVPAGSTEVLLCVTCGKEFERTRTRGRKPSQCPACQLV